MQDVQYVVIGGVASSLQGSNQLTYDIDLTYELSDHNKQRLVEALKQLEARRITEDVGELGPPTVGHLRERIESFVCPIGDIDVFSRVHRVGGYAELVGKSEQIMIEPGLEVRIADLDTLIESKTDTGREKDILAVVALRLLRDERTTGSSQH